MRPCRAQPPADADTRLAVPRRPVDRFWTPAGWLAGWGPEPTDWGANGLFDGLEASRLD